MNVPAPRRLALTGLELATLAGRAGWTPPPGFGGPRAAPGALRRAEAGLVERGIMTTGPGAGGPSLAVPVAANLAVFAAAVATICVESRVRGDGSTAWYAVTDRLGASLFALGDGAAELSLFPAELLGRELIRAVPSFPPDDETARAFALGLAPEPPPAGRAPLAALAHQDADPDTADGTPLSWREREFAEHLRRRTFGMLRCLVTGAPDGWRVAGQVLWLATDAGWVGALPAGAEHGRRMVDLIPVTRQQIGAWIAPHLSTVVGATR
ncbi:hypothetical protein [Pilimelia columellifera]|uniref:Uncharacterized protein n=1 Tax=Pilimelia columellifera subsp. columellifera TaxID=706583 RepID=A0ABN3MXS2_9ACTN